MLLIFLKLFISNACTMLLIITLVHHKIKHGYWFNWSNLSSHESIEALLSGIIIGLIIG